MGLVYNLQTQTPVRQTLRQSVTQGERLLWECLKGSRTGFKFRRQYGVGSFVVDFYCASIRLAIEIDGASHQNPGASFYNQTRQSMIEALGITIIRFSEREAVQSPQMIADQIRAIAEKQSSLLT